jgi:hypothetical protein
MSSLKDTFSAQAVAAVTPNDSTDLTALARAIYVGGTGAVKVTMVNGDTPTFTGVQAGSILPIAVRRVWSTGTTATSILALR